MSLKVLYKAIAYLRLSKEDGDEAESNSIRNQRILIEDYVKRQADIFEIANAFTRAKGEDAPYTLIVRAEDQEKMDTILQNLDVTPIAKPEPTAKNNLSHEAFERESVGRGTGSVERKADRPSIKPKVAAAKNRAAAMRAATQRMRPAPAAERG